MTGSALSRAGRFWLVAVRQQEESLGFYTADVLLYTRRSNPDYPSAVQEDLALHAFLRGLLSNCCRDSTALSFESTGG